MEAVNSGVIGVVEDRANLDAMKALYRAEYKKLVDDEKKSSDKISSYKWKIKLGEFGARIGLLFRPPSTLKFLTKIGSRVVSFISRKALTIKNNIDKKRYAKKKDELTADFINGEGMFSQFTAANQTTIEEIEDKKETGLIR